MTGRPLFQPDRFIRVIFWLLVYAFILSYLHPELILRDTVVTGGDTASHYFTAEYLRDHLLPHGRIMGWQPGNFAGFPLFQFYFPLPFLIMVGLNLLIPMTVAFKIVTVAGILSLPWAAYSLLRNLGHDRAVSDIGALFTLPFLFMEANSAWGGNILSTMAGEFAYGIGLSLALIYLGRLFRDITTGRRAVTNALLLALVGLSHGYTLLFCVIGAAFFLITTDGWVRRLAYILKVNILAFCFMGFWIAPLLLFSPYTVPYNFVWLIHSWTDVLPQILWPFALLGLAGLIYSLISGQESDGGRQRIRFLVYLILVSGVFYFVANKIGVVDIRFLPFGQILVLVIGAGFTGRLILRLRARHLAVLGLAVLTCVWVGHYERVVTKWTAWNYSGYEPKSLWPAFSGLTGHLKGDFAQPRVAYEHGEAIEAVGSLRAFESLPHFSGRGTLEGLYMQSSLSAPFVFYIQSEISQQHSSPLVNYCYSRFDLERGLKHLELFNTGQYITVSEASRLAALQTPGLTKEADFPPFTLFKVAGNAGRYAVQPQYRPVAVKTNDPLGDAFAWFRWSDPKVPLVFADEDTPEASLSWAVPLGTAVTVDALRHLPHQPTPETAKLRETVTDSEIAVEGCIPGQPLWIRISYHPDWQVEGADRVWRASPAFMMVVPTSDRVRLHFGRTFPDYLGLALTFAAILFALFFRRFARRFPASEPMLSEKIPTRLFHPLALLIRPYARFVLWGVVLAVCAGVIWLVAAVHDQDPTVAFRSGLRLFQAEQYDRAQTVFREAAAEFPLSPVIDSTWHHMALCDFKRDRFESARRIWRDFEAGYPESRLLPEALYHVNLSLLREGRLKEATVGFEALMVRFPASKWALDAGQRLSEIGETELADMFEQALDLFSRGRYDEARQRFGQIGARTTDEHVIERSVYYSALCSYNSGDTEAARRSFLDLLSAYPKSEYAAEALFHLGLISLRSGAQDRAAAELQALIRRFPDSRWSEEAQHLLDSTDRSGTE